MRILFARAAVPVWLVVLGVGALLAPAGIATTVLLVALGLACIPAVISIGVWKRPPTSSGGLKRFSKRGSADLRGEPFRLASRTRRVRATEVKSAQEAPGYREPTAGVMGVWHAARHPPKAIDAEFVVEDVTPGKLHP